MDTLGKILLWAVGSLVVLVWGLSALVGSAVAVASASEEGISWVLHHLPGLLLLAFMAVVASKIGTMLERALDYVRYELRYDLKRTVDRWSMRSIEKSLRQFHRLSDESYRLESEGKHLRAWITRRRASAAL